MIVVKFGLRSDYHFVGIVTSAEEGECYVTVSVRLSDSLE